MKKIRITLSTVTINLVLVLILSVISGCNDDEPEPDPINTFDIFVSDPVLIDERNNGTAADFTVNFNAAGDEELITEYRVIVGPLSSLSGPNASSTQGLSEDRYVVQQVLGTPSYSVGLLSTTKDIDGNSIELGTTYAALVVAVAERGEESFDAISNPSDEVTLVINPETETFVGNFPGNGSVVVGSDGSVYVNEYGVAQSDNSGTGTRAFKISPEGRSTAIASDLSGPVGNTVDNAGNYYFNNGNNNSRSDLMKLTPDGEKTFIASLNGFSGDILLSKDESYFLIPSFTEPRISKVTMDGEVSVVVEDSRLSGVVGIAHGEDGNVLLSNFGSGVIMSMNEQGGLSVIATIPTVITGFVIGYITYFEGHIYATGYGSNIIYKVSLEGEVTELAGTGERESVNGDFDKSAFITPNGIDVDPERRRLYISQNGNGSNASLRVIPL